LTRSRPTRPAPYLRFYNHKAAKDAVIPLSQRVVEQIRRQQRDLGDRFAAPPPFLHPGIRKNPDGKNALTWSTLNRRLQRWLTDCDIRDAADRPVKVTAHQFRHTVGTRMINNGYRWTSSIGCSTTARQR
jgi:integrase